MIRSTRRGINDADRIGREQEAIVGQRSDKAQEALMDSAEELFARHGIDAVSLRRITERAGTANHSAVTYHFGSRDGLVRALINRHLESVAERRAELVAALGTDPEFHDVVACRILPWVEQLDSLPVPSWRARFLAQVRQTPSLESVLATSPNDTGELDDLVTRMSQFSTGVSSEVLRARIGILSHLVFGACAEYEAQRQDQTAKGSWLDVGYFLIDSIVGLLTAPQTRRGEYLLRFSTPPLL
ncbi:TetR/AcrR family transcriptional regulator [Dietzia alimentaria]|uniref:TetR/AcrR family transcriptional regulator n=1 Tax=Dietzia alimentaria TaxID=665550 RepID=UPI0002F7FCCB|nr:helix-turn-helix domain-containing protein [Dietzia alimentaria]